MKNLVYVLLFTLALCACDKPKQLPKVNGEHVTVTSEAFTNNAALEDAYATQKSDIQVSGSGVVTELLSDDNNGSPHQRFLVKINAKQTLLFAHNLDLSSYIPLQVGDEISFSGEYVYNPKGGVVHWTHRDPKSQHMAGWVLAHGKKYQ
jgi:Protein of unknown function (DUF3465)